eukprot:scaffold53547_cov28-Tisochrysis_lutea.AAC.2
MLALSLPLLSSCVASSRPPLVEHLQSSASPLVLVDGNNLRGATVFALSQRELALSLSRWAESHQLPCVLVMDHGEEQRAWPVGPYAAITLAGPSQSADDVLVRDTWWALHEGREVAVFTADRGLTSRVRRQKSAGTIQVVPSLALAQLIAPEGALPPAVRGGGVEKTAQRAASARLLSQWLDSNEAPTASKPALPILGDYLRWVTDAPIGANDPAVPSPSMKRRLRRKRHMKSFFKPKALMSCNVGDWADSA